jgi:hypothetical protein
LNVNRKHEFLATLDILESTVPPLVTEVHGASGFDCASLRDNAPSNRVAAANYQRFKFSLISGLAATAANALPVAHERCQARLNAVGIPSVDAGSSSPRAFFF